MASAPLTSGAANDGGALHGAEITDRVLLIPTRDIELGERLRAVDPVWAEALGQLMARDGQQTPIEVCRLPGRTFWTVVAGGHRYEAARSAGLDYLRAIVVSANRDERRLREVNENLWRKDLDPLDRAAFMAEAVLIQKRRAGVTDDARRTASVPAIHAQAIAAEADATLEIISNVYGWSEEVGEHLGFTGRTIRNDLYLYRRLAPSLVARLRDARHPVARNATQLRALAKLDPKLQANVVDSLLGAHRRAPCGTVAAAVKQLQPGTAAHRTDADSKRLSAFLGAFRRMSLVEQKGALAALAPLLPAGVRLVDRTAPKPPAATRDHAAGGR